MFECDRGELSPPLSLDNNDLVARLEPGLVWGSISVRGRRYLKKSEPPQISQRFSARCPELLECRDRLGTFGHEMKWLHRGLTGTMVSAGKVTLHSNF
jgi:hypothetical protein